MHKAYSASKQGLHPEAIDFYLQGMKTLPSHFSCAFNLGSSFELIGKHANALKWFKKASSLDPSSFDAIFGMALNHFKLGQFDMCLRVLSD